MKTVSFGEFSGKWPHTWPSCLSEETKRATVRPKPSKKSEKSHEDECTQFASVKETRTRGATYNRIFSLCWSARIVHVHFILRIRSQIPFNLFANVHWLHGGKQISYPTASATSTKILLRWLFIVTRRSWAFIPFNLMGGRKKKTRINATSSQFFLSSFPSWCFILVAHGTYRPRGFKCFPGDGIRALPICYAAGKHAAISRELILISAYWKFWAKTSLHLLLFHRYGDGFCYVWPDNNDNSCFLLFFYLFSKNPFANFRLKIVLVSFWQQSALLCVPLP